MQSDVLTATLVLIFIDIPIHTAGLDVKQFVNQVDPIWTYKTTRREHIKCEVDQLVSTRPLSITFKRCAFLRGSRCDFRILGVFDTQHKDRMTILHRDTFRRVEKLLFMAMDRSCAVFKVESLTDWDQFYYDLRLTNSFVRTRPLPGCRSYFRRVIGHRPSFYVYNPQCQRLIMQEN
ncbi:hypothetical protein MTO96_035791 [Rhipicephalus appendiculatus]